MPEVFANPPPQRLIDIDGHRREELGVDCMENLQSAHDGHIVLERSPAKQYGYGSTRGHDAAPAFQKTPAVSS
jgi:hypothetical protein